MELHIDGIVGQFDGEDFGACRLQPPKQIRYAIVEYPCRLAYERRKSFVAHERGIAGQQITVLRQKLAYATRPVAAFIPIDPILGTSEIGAYAGEVQRMVSLKISMSAARRRCPSDEPMASRKASLSSGMVGQS